MLVGDGCVLIAIALVATTGGNPWVCGAAFAAFHAFYSLLGVLVVSEIVTYSDTFGGIVALVGSLILLKHFVHHRLHHISRGDCSCEHHHIHPVSNLQIISTAAALSIHALAAGPIVSEMSGLHDTRYLVAILIVSSLFVGLFVSLVVLIGETRRASILKGLDALPGIVTATLTGVCCYMLFHLLQDTLQLSSLSITTFVFVSLAASAGFGYWIHTRGAPQLVQLSPRSSKH
jgi:Na+/pantothenate symporter